MGTLPTSYSNPKGKNKMKPTFALVVVLFAAATLADECQIYRGAVEKLAVEIASRQPRPESLSAPDGVCEDGEGWACSRDCQCGYGVHHQYWHWQPPGYLPVCHGRHWCWQRLCRLCLLGDELRGCGLLEAQAVDYKFEITLINFK